MAIEKILNTTRQHLGELGAMSEQTQRAERKILERAEQALVETDKRIKELRPLALANDERSSKEYQKAIAERGRLQMVIAQARQHLGQ